MSRILLIRHAQTDTAGLRLTGRSAGVHLNSEGLVQAERLARQLEATKITAIYSSPLERAMETGKAIAAERRIPLRTSEAIHELEFGHWTGRTINDLSNDPVWKRFNAQRSVTRIPGGETMLEVQSRIVTELERMRAAHPEEIIAVVSHGDPIRAALAHYLGIHLDLMQRFEISPASISTIELGVYDPRVLAVNVT